MSLIPKARTQVERALGLAAFGAFVAPLVTRLLIGQAFYQTGSGKLQNLEGVTAFFSGLGIPFPELNAAFVSRLELYGGLLLVVGLLTRLAALGLASTMVVALMTADRESFLTALRGGGDLGLTDVTPVVFLSFLLWLVFSGPGALSLDALAARWIGRRRATEDETRVAVVASA